MKRFICIIMMLCLMTIFFAACGATNIPCESCNSTPTKPFKNDYTGENEYYCDSCSSDCAFCSNEATTHYTSALGVIVFVCDDCKEEIQSFN